MKGELWLSEAVDIKDLLKKKLNLIVAKPGAGKTYWARTVMRDYSLDNYLYDALYLIDTSNGKKQLLSKGDRKINLYTGEEYWELDGLHVMTYAGFVTLVHHKPDAWNWYRVVICDELHNCVKYSKWNEYNDHIFAVDYIKQMIKEGDRIVMSITATPDKVRHEFGDTIHDIPLNGKLKEYETKQIVKYYNLSTIVRMMQPGQKGIIYVPHIKTMKKLIEQLNTKGIRANGFWSKYSEEMTDEQRWVRKDVLEQERIPSYIDVLVINSSSETSISIYGDLDFMVIHSCDSDTITQVRGRYRDDLDLLYLHDSTVEDEVILDEKWLNKPLSKEDKNLLCEELNLHNKTRRLLKWSSIKDILENNGYIITVKRIGTKNYSIININT